MTRAELEVEISSRLGDPSNQEFTTTQIDDNLDAAQDRIVVETRCLQDTHTFSIVAGTREYDLPTDYMMSIGVKIDGNPLNPTSKKTLDFYAGESWDDLEGTPTEYYTDAQDPDTKKIGFNYKPNASGTDNCKHLYLVKPASLSLSTSVPFNAHTLLIPYHMVLVHDVVQNLLQYREMTPPLLEKIRFHQMEVNSFNNKIVGTFKNTANKRLRLRGGRQCIY